MRTVIILTAVVTVALVLGVPASTHAQTSTAPSIPYWGPIVSCEGAPGGSYTEKPTCSSLCDLLRTGQNVIYLAATIALFAIAPIFLIYGGVLILTAGGSPQRVQLGRGVLTKVVIGIVIVLGAWVILNTFLWLIGAATNQSGAGGVAWPNIECSVP